MSWLMSWLSAHARAAGLMSASLALLLLVGGVALGMRQAAPATQAAASQEPLRAIPVVAKISTSRHSVSGVVWLVRPGAVWVRSANGVFFPVVWARGAHFHKGGREVPSSSVRVGDRVLVIGTVTPAKRLNAAYVAITGHMAIPARLRPPASTTQHKPAAAPTPKVTHE